MRRSPASPGNVVGAVRTGLLFRRCGQRSKVSWSKSGGSSCDSDHPWRALRHPPALEIVAMAPTSPSAPGTPVGGPSLCSPHVPATAHARWLKPRATCCEADLRRLAEAAQVGVSPCAKRPCVKRRPPIWQARERKSPCFPHIPATAHARWLKPRATCCEADLRRLAEAAQVGVSPCAPRPCVKRRPPIWQARERKSLRGCVCALAWYHRRASAARDRESPVSIEAV